MKRFFTASIACAVLTAGLAQAQGTSSPRLRSSLDYEIGGGFAPKAPNRLTASTSTYGAGVEWNTDMQCGAFDPKISISNTLNGITDGWNSMMDQVISAATAAVSGLPMLILMRASPALAELLQSGVLSGQIQLDKAQLSCENIQDILMGEADLPFESFKASAVRSNWIEAIADSDGDLVRAQQEKMEMDDGADGIQWACSIQSGGAGQPPIRPVRDATIAGYNMLFRKTGPQVCEASYTPSATEADGSPIAEYWPNAESAADWVIDVVGNVSIATADTKVRTTPGTGLSSKLTELTADLAQKIEDLAAGTTDITYENLVEVSAPPGAYVTGGLIRQLQRYSTAGRADTIDRLASEIAYARLVEQGRLAIQLIRSGMREPNIEGEPTAKPYIVEAIDMISDEQRLLDNEMNARKLVAKETIARLTGAEEKRIQTMERPTSVDPSNVNSVGASQ